MAEASGQKERRAYYSKTTCPLCDATLDEHENIYGNSGAPCGGDIGICAYCGALLMWKGRGWVLKPEKDLIAILTPAERNVVENTIASIRRGLASEEDKD